MAARPRAPQQPQQPQQPMQPGPQFNMIEQPYGRRAVDDVSGEIKELRNTIMLLNTTVTQLNVRMEQGDATAKETALRMKDMDASSSARAKEIETRAEANMERLRNDTKIRDKDIDLAIEVTQKHIAVVESLVTATRSWGKGVIATAIVLVPFCNYLLSSAFTASKDELARVSMAQQQTASDVASIKGEMGHMGLNVPEPSSARRR